jgi:crotonobetainyl-CoA:carnitine CoA-transferase CaiB-like acyl-CoA transferase
LRVGVSLGDQLASLYAVIGALLALRVRDQRGEGEHVDVALTEAVISVTEAGIPEYVHEGVVHMRNGNRLSRAAPTGVYPTADGQWVAIGANADSIFRRLAAALERSDWLNDPELATNAGRVRRVDELDSGIADWTAQFPVSGVVDRLNAAGVPCGPVYTVKDISEDPHFRERGALIDVPCPERHGTITMPGVMPVLERRPGKVERTGGPVGQNTSRVLAELLGLDGDEIARLRAAGVIAGA